MYPRESPLARSAAHECFKAWNVAAMQKVFFIYFVKRKGWGIIKKVAKTGNVLYLVKHKIA